MGGGIEGMGRVHGADGAVRDATQHLMLLMMGVYTRNISS